MQSVLSEEVILSCQRQEQLTSHPQLKQQSIRIIKRSQSSKLVHDQRGQHAILQLKQQQSLPQPLHPPPTSSNCGTDHIPNPTNSVSILVYKALNTVFKNSRKIIVRVCDVSSVKKSLTMFKFNKAAAHHRAENRANNCTGHDHFVRPPVSEKKAKQKMKKLQKQNGLKRSNSAIEFDASTLTANGRRQIYSCNRSASSEQDNSDQSEHSEKSPLVNVRLDNLARLFFSKSMPSENGTRDNMHSMATIRPNLRSQYSTLVSGNGINDRTPRDRSHRSYILNALQEWVQKSSGRYEIIVHLDDIGSRRSKSWFLVNDSSVRTDRLMTLLPLPVDCIAQDDLLDECPRKILMELLGSLHHPYIYPVLDLGFLRIDSSNYACLVTPFNSRGSLKDLIYKAQWNEPWIQKYSRKPNGLPTTQIQRLGRQILEALLFLKERGFPLHGHLHSGNVILQNGAARLAGLENGLLGLSSKVNAVIWSRSVTEIENVDIICFGYLIYEMCTGVEMTTPKPSIKMLEIELENYPQILDVLGLIFEPPTGICPSVEELVLCDLFRSIDLRELRGSCFNTIKPCLSRSTLSLLQAVKKHQNSLLGQSLSETVSPCTPPPTPHDKRLRTIKGAAFHSSLDPDDSIFDEFILSYNKVSTSSEVSNAKSQNPETVPKFRTDSQKQISRRQRKSYQNSNFPACSNNNFTLLDTTPNHHYDQQLLTHPVLNCSLKINRCNSSDESSTTKVFETTESKSTDNASIRKTINISDSTYGLQTINKNKSDTHTECQATSSSKSGLNYQTATTTTELVDRQKTLWNGLYKTEYAKTPPLNTSDASSPNHQLMADGRNYNNSKNRRLEYSLKCSKYDRNNTSQDSAFSSLTDGDFSMSSCRLSSFQSVSSPIDEGVEDVTTTTKDNNNLELANIKNKLVSQDSAISSPCRDVNYFRADENIKGGSTDSSPTCTTVNVRPVSLSPKIIVTSNISSNMFHPFINNSQKFDPPKILVNDQTSIYTSSSPSKRFGTIEVFSQKYRVSSFEDMSNMIKISDKAGKHLKYTNKLTFRSLENERRIENAFKPIKERTSSDVGVNRISDKYKKLTHASFRITKTASQMNVFNFSQDIHICNEPTTSVQDLSVNCEAAHTVNRKSNTFSSGTANKRQTIWRDSKLYHENHITKSNDSLLETPSGNLVGFSNSSIFDNQCENFSSLDNSQELNRHCSIHEILKCNQSFDVGLAVTGKYSYKQANNHHYCSSKSEDFDETENCVYIMDSKKSYSERYLMNVTQHNYGVDRPNTFVNSENINQSEELENYTEDNHIDSNQWENTQHRRFFQKRQKLRKLYSIQNSPHRHTKCARTHPNFLSLSACSINRVTTTEVRTTSLATPSLSQRSSNQFQHIRSKTITSFKSVENSLKAGRDKGTEPATDGGDCANVMEEQRKSSSTDELSSRPNKNRMAFTKFFMTDNIVYGCVREEKKPLLDTVEMSPMSPVGPDLYTHTEQM